jgi:hypothetical protein
MPTVGRCFLPDLDPRFSTVHITEKPDTSPRHVPNDRRIFRVPSIGKRLRRRPFEWCQGGTKPFATDGFGRPANGHVMNSSVCERFIFVRSEKQSSQQAAGRAVGVSPLPESNWPTCPHDLETRTADAMSVGKVFVAGNAVFESHPIISA